MKRASEFFHPPRPIAKTTVIPQSIGMAADDRWEALGWYCRRLILQELERGVTQNEIARACQIDQPTISTIKNARSLPSLATAIALAEYFRRTPGELLDEAIKWWEERGGRLESVAVAKAEYERRLAQSTTGKRRLRKNAL